MLQRLQGGWRPLSRFSIKKTLASTRTMTPCRRWASLKNHALSNIFHRAVLGCRFVCKKNHKRLWTPDGPGAKRLIFARKFAGKIHSVFNLHLLFAILSKHCPVKIIFFVPTEFLYLRWKYTCMFQYVLLSTINNTVHSSADNTP